MQDQGTNPMEIKLKRKCILKKICRKKKNTMFQEAKKNDLGHKKGKEENQTKKEGGGEGVDRGEYIGKIKK